MSISWATGRLGNRPTKEGEGSGKSKWSSDGSFPGLSVPGAPEFRGWNEEE